MLSAAEEPTTARSRTRWRSTLRAIGRAHRSGRRYSSSSMTPQAGTLRGGVTTEKPSTFPVVNETEEIYDDFTDSLPQDDAVDAKSAHAGPSSSLPATVAGDAIAVSQNQPEALSTSPISRETAVFGVHSDAINTTAELDVRGELPVETAMNEHSDGLHQNADSDHPAFRGPVSEPSTVSAHRALVSRQGVFPRSPALRTPKLASESTYPRRLAGVVGCALDDLGAPDDSPVQRRHAELSMASGSGLRTPLRGITPRVGTSAGGSGLRHRTPGACGHDSSQISFHADYERRSSVVAQTHDGTRESIEGEPPRTSVGDASERDMQGSSVSDFDVGDDYLDSVSQANGNAGSMHMSPKATANRLVFGSSPVAAAIVASPLRDPSAHKKTPSSIQQDLPSCDFKRGDSCRPTDIPSAPSWLPDSLKPLAQAAIVASRRRIRPASKYRESHSGNADDKVPYDFAIVVRAAFTARQTAALARAKADADARATAALVQARQLGQISPMHAGAGTRVDPANASRKKRTQRIRPRKLQQRLAQSERYEVGSGDSASLSDSDCLSSSSNESPRHEEANDDDYDHSSEDDDSLSRSVHQYRSPSRSTNTMFLDSELPSSDESGDSSGSSSGGEDHEDSFTNAAHRRLSLGTFFAGLNPWAQKPPSRQVGETRALRSVVRDDSSSVVDGNADDRLSLADDTIATSVRRVTFSNTETRSDTDLGAAVRGNRDRVSGIPAATPGHVAVDMHAHEPAGAARGHKCSEILAALRGAGLLAKRVRSLSRRTWLIKLRAPEERLEEEAEAVHLRLRRRDGGWSRFRRSARAAFVHEQSNVAASDQCNSAMLTPQSIFHSSDRQLLINHILRSSSREGGCDLGESSPLGAYVTLMLPLHMRTRLDELRNDWLAPWRPAISQGAHDRIGAVDPAWYAPPVLVSLDAVTRPTGNPAVAGTSWLHNLRLVMSGSGSSSSELGGGTPALAPPPAESISAKNDDSRSRHPRRACGCCLSLCSTVSCAFCCGPVILAWMVVRIASCSARCGRSTTRCCCSLTTQPLDRIASYFGEGIAFYFAWLEFYTQWLLAVRTKLSLLCVHDDAHVAYQPNSLQLLARCFLSDRCTLEASVRVQA